MFLHGPECWLFESEEANQRYSFFLFRFKKITSKIDKHVMLSYFLLLNKRLEFDYCLTPSKVPTSTSQANSLKGVSFDWGIRKRICKTVLVNSGLLFTNYACACKTDSFSNRTVKREIQKLRIWIS